MRTAAVIVFFFLACSGDDRSAAIKPPLQRNQIRELAESDPTAEHLKVNPRPNDATLGCYQIEAQSWSSDWAPLPLRIRLTNVAIPTIGTRVQTSYRVESNDPQRSDDAHWTWTPLIGRRAKVSIGDGFVGWYLELSSEPFGFSGTAAWFTDVPPPTRQAVNVRLSRVACR
jgi:hypothetical protein